MTSRDPPELIPLEDLCLDDLSEEERAKFKADLERAKAAIAAAIKPEEWAAFREMMTRPQTPPSGRPWDDSERIRQAGERLQRHLDIAAGRAPSPVQVELFKRLDALLEAIKSSSAPSPWQEEALRAVLEAFKSSSTPSPWPEEALGRIEASLAALKRQPRSNPQSLQKRGGPQTRRVLRALRELFPPDGRVPQNLEVETVRAGVAGHLEPESRNLGKADPSWEVVKAAIEQLGRRDD